MRQALFQAAQSLEAHLQILDAMAWQEVSEVGGTQVLLSPQVAHSSELLRSYLLQITLQIDIHVLVTHIEDAQSITAIGEWALEDMYASVLHHAFGLASKDVLVDGIHLVVAQETHCEVVHLRYVATDEHIAGHEGPQ